MKFIQYPDQDFWWEWNTERMEAYNYNGGHHSINENGLGDCKYIEAKDWHDLYLKTGYNPMECDVYERDVWISPEGVYYYGDAHAVQAEHICEIIYGQWFSIDYADDFLDHNKRNNALSNLEWVSKAENMRRARVDYMDNATVKGEEVVVKEKKKKKNTATKKIITGLYVYSKHNNHKMEPVFISATEPEKIHEVLAPYYGKVPDMSKKGINKVVKAILDGTNTAGMKKYCSFRFQAKVETVIEETIKIQYKKVKE